MFFLQKNKSNNVLEDSDLEELGILCHLKAAATTELEKIWITNTACGVTHKAFSFDSCIASTTVISSIKVSCSYGNFCVPWVKQSLATYV